LTHGGLAERRQAPSMLPEAPGFGCADFGIVAALLSRANTDRRPKIGLASAQGVSRGFAQETLS